MVLRAAAEHSVPLIDAALDDERRSRGSWTDARPALEAAFQQDQLRASGFLREVARMPRFREALLWQNRGAVHGGIAALLRRPLDATDAKTRKLERAVAIYLQRYCVKNDTIGFFGPVGWGMLDDQVVEPRIVPGPALLDRRTVYFEHWAINALADQLSEDRALRITLAPRRMPTIRIEGDLLHHPIDRTSPLSPATARLLQACDGERPAHAIAAELVAEGSLELASADDVYDLLDELVEAKLVIWRLEVPTAGFGHEHALRAALAGSGSQRQVAEEALTELEVARDRVAAAAGHPEALDEALGSLEETFVRLTGKTATRLAGQTYAGRSIVFEDCRRDLKLVMGRPFLDRIAAPLSFIQASARWYAYAIAARFEGVFAQVYRTVAAAVGSPDVDFIRYFSELRPQLSGQLGTQSPTVAELRLELQRRWANVLQLPSGVRRVELHASDLAPRVDDAFAAPSVGWPSARHHSPDLLLAAAGPEAIARGDYLVVLGEVHACVSTITTAPLANQHVDPARLHQARYAEVGRSVARVEPRGTVHRATFHSHAEDDLDVEFGDARSNRPRSHVFDVAGFFVTERDGRLKVRRRDGSLEFDLVAFLEGDLTAESFTFDMFGAIGHRPRVTVDGFVLARERWRFEASDLAFVKLAAPLERFVGARRWAATHQIPRFTFIKAPTELKPIYLDLDSPIFVEIFCKLVRGGDDAIIVTEMLPTFDQLWLLDAEGSSYCGELRFVMVDDQAWTQP
jgi:hypothetical protein